MMSWTLLREGFPVHIENLNVQGYGISEITPPSAEGIQQMDGTDAEKDHVDVKSNGETVQGKTQK